MTNAEILAIVSTLEAQIVALKAQLTPKVEPDDPTHVKLEKTGHVLPAPNFATGWPQYVYDVGKALGWNTSLVGQVYLGANDKFFPSGFSQDAKVWAEGADRLYWPRLYMTPEQVAADDELVAAWKAAGY